MPKYLFGMASVPHVVLEHGQNFRGLGVRPEDGLFRHQRENRALVARRWVWAKPYRIHFATVGRIFSLTVWGVVQRLCTPLMLRWSHWTLQEKFSQPNGFRCEQNTNVLLVMNDFKSRNSMMWLFVIRRQVKWQRGSIKPWNINAWMLKPFDWLTGELFTSLAPVWATEMFHLSPLCHRPFKRRRVLSHLIATCRSSRLCIPSRRRVPEPPCFMLFRIFAFNNFKFQSKFK